MEVLFDFSEIVEVVVHGVYRPAFFEILAV